MRIITNLDNKTWKNQEPLKDIQQQMQSQHAQNTEKYHNLRQDVLNDQRRSINFWMTVFVVTFSTVFSAVSTLVYFETKELQQKAEICNQGRSNQSIYFFYHFHSKRGR
jgi:hypothetical protein